MEDQVMRMVQATAGILGGILMLVALVLLWQRSRSPWLLLALAGEAASWLFRVTSIVIPTLLGGQQAMIMIWQGAALMVAAGLLGYALEQQSAKSS